MIANNAARFALRRLAIGFLLAQCLFTWSPGARAASRTTPVKTITSGGLAKSVAFRGITQPSFTTCGQTSVAMITGVDVDFVIRTMGTNRGTTASQLIEALRRFNPRATPKIVQLDGKNPRADSIVYLMDTSSGGGHWTVFHDGKYYDPVFGKLGEYPPWIRKQFAISVG
jgi:hypothetical protein